MSTKKYISLSKLSTFLDKLKDTFALRSHNHTFSDITDISIDTELSSTSTNPVANNVLNEEFEAIGKAMNVLESAINDKSDLAHTHTYDELEEKPFYAETDYHSILTDGEATINFYNWGNGVYGSTMTGLTSCFVADQTYKVFWDGTEYALTGSYSGDNTAGNPIYSIGAAYGDYSTYPFGVDSYITTFGTYEFDFHTNSTNSVHTVDVWVYGEKIFTIDEKYIPTLSVSHGGTGHNSITEGVFLIGNGTEAMVEMAASEVLNYINGANVEVLSTAEYEELEANEAVSANTLYMVTDADEEAYVQYTEQELTDEQKAQARENIGAINTDIDTTLTIEGSAADAKATGDAINDLEDDVNEISTLVGTESVSTQITNALESYYTKTEVDDAIDSLEFITTDDIDEICGTIPLAEDVYY